MPKSKVRAVLSSKYPDTIREDRQSAGKNRFNAGWSSPVARQAHNLKVVSSNLAPATKFNN